MPPQAESLAFDRDGNLLVGVSADHNGNGAIEKFNINNGNWMSTLVTGIGTPTGIALVASGVEDTSPPAVDLDATAGGTGYTQTYSGTPVMITNANATVTDADSPTLPNLASITAAIVGTHAGDTLTANTAGTSITASYSAGTLSLTGSDTVANYQAVLRTIRYQNTAGGPGVSVVMIDVTANDGFLDSNTAVATIDIPPILDLDSVAAGTGFTTGWYNSGTNAGGAVPITNMTNATITAPSGVANLTDMTVTLTSFHTGDVLSIPSLPGLNITPTYTSGTLSLIGSDTLAHYQQALRFISYNNTTGVGPGVSTVTVSIVATDGALSSNLATSTININNGQSGGGQVLGNRLFYNNSKYDANNTAINGASDDAAIATDKIGYLQGTATAATYANVSNFFRGITGVMVDLSNAIGHALEHQPDQQRYLVQVHFGGCRQRLGGQQRGGLGRGSFAGGDFDPHRRRHGWLGPHRDHLEQWLDQAGLVGSGREGQRQHGSDQSGYLLLRQRDRRLERGRFGRRGDYQRQRRHAAAQQPDRFDHAGVERDGLHPGRHDHHGRPDAGERTTRSRSAT